MLASDHGSSEESIQSYFARKIKSKEGEEKNESTSNKTLLPIKESESSPIAVTPARKPVQRGKSTGDCPTRITFLGPRAQSLGEVDNEQDRKGNKRPRLWSASTLGTFLQSEDLSQTVARTDCDPNLQDPDEMEQEFPTGRLATFSSSEFGIETDAESSYNPAVSTIAQTLNVRTQRTVLDVGDSGSAFIPVGLPSTSKSTLLGPSCRAVIKEFFSNAETFDFPKGHATIAFTEDQISTVVKAVAEETVRTSCDEMEKLIQKARDLNLGTRPSRDYFPEESTVQGSQRSGSLTTCRHSDTSGALRSDDEFSSIGYSFERAEPEKVNAPPCVVDQTTCSYKDPQSNMDACDGDSPGGQTLASLEAEAIGDRNKRSRNRKGR